MLPDLHIGFSRDRSGGLVPSLSEFSTVYCDPHSQSFGIVNKAEIDVFLELSCFFDDPADVGNLTSSSKSTGIEHRLRQITRHTRSQNVYILVKIWHIKYDYDSVRERHMSYYSQMTGSSSFSKLVDWELSHLPTSRNSLLRSKSFFCTIHFLKRWMPKRH